jgi:DNA-binding GntR family transcriptional regulator
VIADYGVIVTHVRERFCFARPDQDVADLLGASDEDPVLRITRTAYCMNNTPIEYRVSHYLSRNFNYEIEIS